jgi:predicted CXXCH cytochrome family protein
MRRWIVVVVAAALAACQGEKGPAGSNGGDGGPGPQGPVGPSGPQGPAAGFVALEAAGVVGVVADTSGAQVGSGKVIFVPAAAVAALGPTSIAVDSDTDEPLEDLIRLNGATYPQTDVGADGVYRLATLPAGAYFPTFVPAEGASVLPGGSACRTARASAALVGTRLDITVSSAIPADAEYVGSSKCMGCHGRAHISGTMHRLGIWSATQSGPMQDLAARRTDLYQAIDTKFVTGTKVYLYDYDATRGFDKYKTAETDPGANVSFTVALRQDGAGALWMDLHNAKNAADPDVSYKVDAIYGGGVMKQRYLTKLTNASGFFHALLPLQFQNEGSESYPDRTAKVWRDYNAFKWFDETTTLLKKPAAKDSFEKNCVSCHAAGVRVTGSDTTTWTAATVADPIYGDFDYDGDGVKEEMNVGCESCHGPGSRHWEAAGQGKHIVSLSLLTPEREAMVCGQCHSRPKGALNTDSPVNAAGMMMVAGTSRNDYLKTQATSQLDGAAADFYTDAAKHSKSHHQQYTDFIRSALYKNGSSLMTCSGCHDPHQKTASKRQLRKDPGDNAALCGSCHASTAADLSAHLAAKGIFVNATKAAIALCTDCHMPKTAKTGSGQPGAVIGGVQYWMNDVSSHVFDMPRKADSGGTIKMPTAYTNACGACHGAL